MKEQAGITQLLMAWNNGEETALEDLIPLVEQELRRLARKYLRGESAYHTLQTTALVNEAYMRLMKQHSVFWENRGHFFALSAQIMRRILINHARNKNCEKRGNGATHITLSRVSIVSEEKTLELLALNEALEKLAEFDKLKSQIVELRYFGGFTVDEVADILEISSSTVATHWRLAKAWLKSRLKSYDDCIGNNLIHSKLVGRETAMSV
jgi:RNA polymerase sigma-70 factor, ECF subfamily